MSGPFDRGTGPNPWSTLFGPGSSGFGRSNVRWRIFDRGDLKYMILELLRERPMHGYEVMRALEKTSQGCYSASPGSVYPALQSLEDDGYVSGVEEDGRKVYTITDEGREFLDRNRDRVEDILHRLGDFARHFSGAPMTDVTKSFGGGYPAPARRLRPSLLRRADDGRHEVLRAAGARQLRADCAAGGR
jgi:DNA-binding PadR family transcriptional regulator